MTQLEESMEQVRSADGARISYRRGGSGPPLVLVHGTFDDHRLWQQVSPALEESFSVYAIDRRGRGDSGAQGRTYAVEREYEDLAAVVEEIGEPAHLLGHSLGARYALHAALLVPDHLRSLVLYEPLPFYIPPPEIMERFRAFEEADDRDGILVMYYEDLAGVPPEIVEQMRGTPEWHMAADNAHTFPTELRSFSGYRFDPASFADLHVPTLLLLGSESPPFLRVQTVAVAAALPDARIVTLAGGGHDAMLRAPELFVREVTRFFAEL